MGGVRVFRSMPNDKALKPVLGFLASVALHVAAFALITQFDFASSYQPPRVEMSDPGPIFIDLQALKELHILRALPEVKPAGPGGQPGSAQKPVQVVFQASTAQHPKFTIVLKPLKPDNNRQAINNKLSPPDLKLQLEQKLPDIVLPDNPAVPRPRLDMALRQPVAPKLQNQKVDAPNIASNAAPGSPFKGSNPNIARPQVDMSLRQPNAPGNVQNQKSEAAPVIAGNGPTVDFQISATVRQPQLPVAYVSGSMQAPHAGGSGSGRPGGGGGSPNGSVNGTGGSNGSGDPSGGIVVVSIDPSAFSQLASLAQGNRYGQLAIAPSKEGAGSPGGSPNGTPGGGSGGPGRGGDGSVGVGPGHSGGGGGGAEGSEKATFSAVGGTGRSIGGVDANRLLAPVLPSTVFAVPVPASKLRRPPLVVATGPMGGGGLDTYGALSCGKVYTVFMPMPGKNWILQYCAHDSSAAKAPQESGNGVVQVEAGLVPPIADQQFDFRRLTIPEKDAEKLIVLRGVIGKDGAINEVHVFQGVLAEMDAEAALAFSNWKFRPATRAGLPISVDILVGIPARLPEKLNASSGAAPGNVN